MRKVIVAMFMAAAVVTAHSAPVHAADVPEHFSVRAILFRCAAAGIDETLARRIERDYFKYEEWRKIAILADYRLGKWRNDQYCRNLTTGAEKRF